MAIDELYQAGTDKVLDDRVARPLNEPPPQRSFAVSAWNMTSAPVKGVGAGATEVEAAGFDIFSAFGKIASQELAQSDPSNLFDHKAAEKAQVDSAGLRAEVKSGAAFSTEVGTSFRQSAREYAPDPATAGTVENLLFGLPRFMTKAVGYTAVGGAVPGAVMLGADEGMTEADRLKADGVDINTRTKVAGVAGVVAGASVLLPVAGNSWKTTAGLVAAGGPGAFMAQQAASKAILEHAGYDKLADQYDPLDPVGLAVSTLVPAAFGAHATRAARGRPAPVADPVAARQLAQMAGNEKLALKYDDPRLDSYAVTAAQREGISPAVLLAIKNAGEKSGPKAVSEKGAQGVMQFMPDTWAEFGKGDPRDPTASIDAAARYMKSLIEKYDGNEQAAIAHYNGGNKAGRAVMEGRAPPAKETRDYLARTERHIAETKGEEAGRAAAQDPDMVAAARVQQVRETLEASNLHDPDSAAGHESHFDAAMRAADQIGAGEPVDVGAIADLDHGAQAELLNRMAARLEAAHQDMAPDTQAAPHEVATQTQTDLQALAGLRQTMDEVSARAPKPAPDQHATVKFDNPEAASNYIRDQKISKTHRAEQTGRDTYTIRPRKTESTDWRAKVADREAKLAEQLRVAQENAAARAAKRQAEAPPKAPDQAAAEPPAPKAPATASGERTAGAAPEAGANPIAASIEAQAGEIAKFSPDMLVQLEGMEAPMRLADALEAVKAEAAKDAKDAPLFETAAQCALQNL